MTLLPSESQQPDGRLSLVWTMVYALAAAFAFGFFNDVVVGRWHPELNEGAQVPRPRESVRRPLALFLYVFVGLYFFSALAFLSRGAADEPFAAGRMSVAALVAAVLLTAIFYGMKRLLCRRSGGREAGSPVKRSGCGFNAHPDSQRCAFALFLHPLDVLDAQLRRDRAAVMVLHDLIAYVHRPPRPDPFEMLRLLEGVLR